jgi:hypothetical protein
VKVCLGMPLFNWLVLFALAAAFGVEMKVRELALGSVEQTEPV